MARAKAELGHPADNRDQLPLSSISASEYGDDNANGASPRRSNGRSGNDAADGCAAPSGWSSVHGSSWRRRLENWRWKGCRSRHQYGGDGTNCATRNHCGFPHGRGALGHGCRGNDAAGRLSSSRGIWNDANGRHGFQQLHEATRPTGNVRAELPTSTRRRPDASSPRSSRMVSRWPTDARRRMAQGGIVARWKTVVQTIFEEGLLLVGREMWLLTSWGQLPTVLEAYKCVNKCTRAFSLLETL